MPDQSTDVVCPECLGTGLGVDYVSAGTTCATCGGRRWLPEPKPEAVTSLVEITDDQALDMTIEGMRRNVAWLEELREYRRNGGKHG